MSQEIYSFMADEHGPWDNNINISRCSDGAIVIGIGENNGDYCSIQLPPEEVVKLIKGLKS